MRTIEVKFAHQINHKKIQCVYQLAKPRPVLRLTEYKTLDLHLYLQGHQGYPSKKVALMKTKGAYKLCDMFSASL